MGQRPALVPSSIVSMRRWLRSLGLVGAVSLGIVSAFLLADLVDGVSSGFVMPALFGAFRNGGPPRDLHLHPTLFDARLNLELVLRKVIDLAATCALVYAIFLRPLSAPEYDVEGLRACPECRSDVVVAATRCPFCTGRLEVAK